METIGHLAGGVAHDYNNILSTIIGFAELAIQETDKDSPVHYKLEEILKAAFRSADVTRQLLGFARKQMVAPKVFDANAAVEGLLGMLGQLLGEHIDLSWKPSEGPVPVHIDMAQFDQIVMNLCVNGRDAIQDRGKITLQTRLVEVNDEYCKELKDCRPGTFVVLSVVDNGVGMDAETLENMFVPFFSTKEKTGGTGLGLASVFGIVKQAGGFIHAESLPGKGTRLDVYLPAHHA